MKVYIERNNLQVELIWFREKYWLYSRLLSGNEEFNAISPTANQEVSNTNYFGCISDSLPRLGLENGLG